jgi:hypothetical protein
MAPIQNISTLGNWHVDPIEQTGSALVNRGTACRDGKGILVRGLWGLVFLLAGSGAFAQTENSQVIEAAQAVSARVQPAKPRRLLIYTPSEYDGHNAAIAYANEAFGQMGQKTGAFEVTVTDDPSFFERPSLSRFDAVFLNNTIGKTLPESRLRQNLLEFVTGGGGLMGVHGTVIAFTKNLWPAVEDWPEFGYMIGARGMLQFYLDAAQFVLGDLEVPTTPSAKLSPAVLAQEKLGWRLGIEAYTFHKFTFFETIEKTAELGPALYRRPELHAARQRGHPEELRSASHRRRAATDSAQDGFRGVRLLTYYAQDIPSDEAGCRKLFEFGRKMGIETFMCEPKPEQLDLLDKLANEYGINVAIHNHGQNISPHYWHPEGVLKACEGRSKRIGAAPDLGYWLRSGIDPVEGARL